VSTGQAPGWYADPQDVSRLRWWDGHRWTPHTHHTAPLHVAPPRPALPRRWGTMSVLTQVALVGIALVTAYSIWVDRQVLAHREELRMRPDTVTAADADRIQTLLVSTVLASAWMLVTGVLFISWLYTAHRSNRMDPTVLKQDSGWAIGSWFVPVMNFWQPFLMVTDVRRGALGDPRARPALSQGWWWGLFAGSYVLSWGGQLRAAVETSVSSSTTMWGYSDVTATAAETHQWAGLVSLAAALMAVVVVRDLTRLVLAPPPARASA
jgi:hypothetical protein